MNDSTTAAPFSMPPPAPAAQRFPIEPPGRVVLVTGAARGIGLAVVRAFADAGCAVAGWDVPGCDWREAAAAAAPAGWLALQGDVASAADWQRVLAAVRQRFERLDVLVNNAGVGGALAPLVDYDDAEYDRTIAVNQRGVYLGLKHGGAWLRERGSGCIVNIASNMAFGGGPLTIAYTASKHAVLGMTKVAASELGRAGVRVLAVCPSPTATEMMAGAERAVEALGAGRGDADTVRRQLQRRNPTGRYAEPDEIAATVRFLASDSARYVNGTSLLVDGGMSVG